MRSYFITGLCSFLIVFCNKTIGQVCFTDATFITADGAVGFEYGDFNNDGNIDLVVCNGNSVNTDNGSQHFQNIVIHLGDGKGEFTETILYDANEQISPSNIVVEDFDSDDNLDVAMNGGKGVLVAFGDGKGSFSHHKSFCADEPYYVVSNDFNGDGILDIATANLYQNTVSILFGDGRGNFGIAKNFDVDKEEPTDIKSDDFNNDGFPDLVMGSQHHKNTKIIVLLNDGEGNFDDLTKYDVSGQQDGVITADFNSDGNIDIATCGGGSLNVYIGDGTGKFNNHEDYPDVSDGNQIRVGDINGDCILDIIIANWNYYNSSDQYIVYEGDGLGGFGNPTIFSASFNGANGICVADFNHDNKSDLIFLHGNDDRIGIMMNCTEDCYCTNTIDIQIACDAYTWIDGVSYSNSTTSATFTFSNNQGCDSAISLDLTIRETNKVNKLFLCKGDTMNIHPSIKDTNYLWQDSSSVSSFEVTKPGTYWVQMNSNGCLFTDTYTIIEENCEVTFEIPNVFTPNNDGINDVFTPISINRQFEIKYTIIYNRWGRKVFESNDKIIQWDAKDVSDGIYYYYIEYNEYGNQCEASTYKGYVNVLR